MDDFLARQFSLLREASTAYRSREMSLGRLVGRIEAIGNVIGGDFWDSIFNVVLDLESINSELIDKNREITDLERESVLESLVRLEEVIAAKDVG
ncbi:hypothetical protein [Variovorax sp. LT2P21]|uniref:hypothetical protein n=1 Tax=Variovorax sp. LT2P21 TaxID=3443731 RepID=UPI003F49675F